MEVLVRLGDGNETDFEQTQLPEYQVPDGKTDRRCSGSIVQTFKIERCKELGQ